MIIYYKNNIKFYKGGGKTPFSANNIDSYLALVGCTMQNRHPQGIFYVLPLKHLTT